MHKCAVCGTPINNPVYYRKVCEVKECKGDDTVYFCGPNHSLQWHQENSKDENK